MAKFNPYREWLNLDAQITAPNYYRLLGLEDLEEDPAVIQAAAAATLERVNPVIQDRVQRVGPNWSPRSNKLENA